MRLFSVLSSYPKFTLGQCLVLIALASGLLGIWFDPCELHRALLGRADSQARIVIGRRSPIAAIYDHDRVKVIDCKTSKIMLQASIPTFARQQRREKWYQWPSVSSAGASDRNTLGLGAMDGNFSPDDQFLVISLQGRYQSPRHITIIEIKTGRQATWKGDKESVYASAKFGPGVVDIERFGHRLFEFRGEGSDLNASRFREDRFDREGLKWWTPRLLGQASHQFEYSKDNVDGEFFQDQSNRCLLWAWDSFAQAESTQLYDLETGAYSPLKRPFEEGTCFIVDEMIPNSNLVKGSLRRNAPDRLAIEESEVSWNVDTGELTKVPDRYGCQITRHGGKLLVCDNEKKLYWIDPASGARESVYTASRFSFWREIGMLLGAAVAMFIAKPTTDKDHSRRLILITAIASTLALLPPAFAYEYYWGLNRTAEQVISMTCLLVILGAALGAFFQRTASLPAIGASFLLVGLLIGPWIGMHGEGQHASNALSYLTYWPNPDFEPDVNDFDILQPWRAQKPERKDSVQVQYQDRLTTIEVEP